MKIEMQCPDCQSTIQVDLTHAGKQVRCPVCGCISQVPVDGEVVSPQTEKPVKVSSPRPPVRDSVFDSPPVSGLPNRVNRRRIVMGVDQRFVLAVIWGTGAILSNFVCCGPIVGCVLAAIGLGNGIASKSRFKQSGIVINLIALVISLAMIFFQYFVLG